MVPVNKLKLITYFEDTYLPLLYTYTKRLMHSVRYTYIWRSKLARNLPFCIGS